MKVRGFEINRSGDVEFTERSMSRSRHLLEQRSAPVACWFRNRWNWREKRRMRTKIATWDRMVVPLDQLDVEIDPATRRLAEMAEGLGYSVVLQFGYGMGEAVVVAVTQEPNRLRPFMEAASRFSIDQLRGADNSKDGIGAVRARNALLTEVGQIISRVPKTG